MRLISTLWLLLFSSFCFSQNHSKNDTIPNKVIFGCRTTFNAGTQPLYVIDGVPYEYTEMVKDGKIISLDPNDIETVNILKASDDLIFSCYKPRKDVIVITTKSANLRKIIIKDFLDGHKIAGATVSFISADKKDTIIIATNDSGIVSTASLKIDDNYQMNISNIGYKKLSQNWRNYNNSKEQVVMLERDIKMCNEVVLTGYTNLKRRIWMGCGGNSSVITTVSKIDSTSLFEKAHIFPNPAKRGNSVTIETTILSDTPIQVRITSLDGKLIQSQPQKAIKGLNRFTLSTDSRWSAGIYLLNLYANGKLLASDKIVIQ